MALEVFDTLINKPNAQINHWTVMYDECQTYGLWAKIGQNYIEDISCYLSVEPRTFLLWCDSTAAAYLNCHL